MNEINQNQETYLLKNVLLETGFLYEHEEIVATKTALFDIQIEANKIKNIEQAQSVANGKAFDVKGKLA
jgi:hypothetical protein